MSPKDERRALVHPTAACRLLQAVFLRVRLEKHTHIHERYERHATRTTTTAVFVARPFYFPLVRFAVSILNESSSSAFVSEWSLSTPPFSSGNEHVSNACLRWDATNVLSLKDRVHVAQYVCMYVNDRGTSDRTGNRYVAQRW